MGAEQVESLAMGTEESLVAARASDQRNETTANTDRPYLRECVEWDEKEPTTDRSLLAVWLE